MKHFFTFLLLFLLFSCSEKNGKLEFALQQSGKNRTELEKVLNHYKNDSLKYLSAVFLIKNMPYYAYEISPEIESTKNLLSKIFQNRDFTDEERQQGIFFQNNSQSVIKQDITEISAENLIENIDYAFKVWQEKPWNKNLSFENFCELILPHRIAEEPLTQWRKKYYEKYNPILDSLYQGSDVIEACNRLSHYIRHEKTFFYFTDFSTPRQGADFQFNNRIGTCRDACDIATFVMRSVGIPVTTDMYLYSPEYQSSHEWNVVRDTTGNYLSFWYEQFYASRDENFTDKRKKGKVFRMTYALQKSENEINKLPYSLQNPFLKDVTKEYFGQNIVSVPIENNIKNVFLGVFTARNGWLPVSQGKTENKKLIFENIEPFVIYQPLIFENNEIKPITYPFMYKKGKIHIFKPDNQTENITITRKYPMRKNTVVKYKNWLKGIQIKASNDANFSKNELLFKMKNLPAENVINIDVNSSKSFRYFQYETPEDSVLSIAEIHFWGENNKITFDTIFSNGKPWKNVALYQLKNAFDNDPVSFFHTWEMGTSIFFHSKTPQKIKKIQLIPRTDDNFIREGDTYELFYNAGAKGWISLGKKIATNEPFLIYDVPKNAVLWLKNKTRGKEEQIFMYNKDRQIFPTFDEYEK